jgi:hypothetical protein
MKISKSEAGKLGQIAALETQKRQFEQRKTDYYNNPKLCKCCNNTISYEKRNNNIYCSSSCAAIVNNIVPKRKRKNNLIYIRFESRTKQKIYKTEKTCINCLSLFMTEHEEQKYCSLKCQQSYQRKEQIENNTASALVIKSYLLEHHGNVCMDPECIWDFSIRPVNVELEHKDGNGDNNILENCILLCPNCHSLTATYKGKNKGNGRHNRRQRYADGKSY